MEHNCGNASEKNINIIQRFQKTKFKKHQVIYIAIFVEIRIKKTLKTLQRN